MTKEIFKGRKDFGPLKGLKVLDIGTLVAGPFAASLLADFGADVIKIELPGIGDSIRQYGKPIKNGSSLAWLDWGRNKYCITLDMRKEKGQELLKRLVEKADVLIENFRPGTLEKWNLGYGELSKINPRLIMTRVSAYGQTGPYRDKPGLDRIALSYSSLLNITGYPDKPPVKMGISIADYSTAIFAALSTLMAIYNRDVLNTGQGQEIDLGLYEAPLRLTEDIIPEYGYFGEIRERMGNRHKSLSPAEVFETKDGRWVTIHAGLDSSFQKLTFAMGQPELAEEGSPFKTTRQRAQNIDEVNEIVQRYVKSKTLKEVLKELEEAGVPVAPVNNVKDLFHDPHIQHRENIITVKDPEIGEVNLPGVVPKFSKTPGKVEWTGKAIGEDNEEVYLNLLELSRKEYNALRKERVI